MPLFCIFRCKNVVSVPKGFGAGRVSSLKSGREDRSCSGCRVFLKGNIDCQSESTWSPQFGHWRAQIVVLSVRVHYPKEPLRGERFFFFFWMRCASSFPVVFSGRWRVYRERHGSRRASRVKVGPKRGKQEISQTWIHTLKKRKHLAHRRRPHSILTKLSHALQFYFFALALKTIWMVDYFFTEKKKKKRVIYLMFAAVDSSL